MLTDNKCKAAVCPPEKARLRLADAGGLYLEIRPTGAKLWRWKYRYGRSEKVMALGRYPAVTLAKARAARDAAKLQKAKGIDPMAERMIEKLKSSTAACASFRAVALEWFGKHKPMWSEGHASRTQRQLERDLFPYVGDRPLDDISATELLGVVQKVEKRGALETASRDLMLAGQVWRYAVATGRAMRDITTDLKGALAPYHNKHFGAITDPKELGALLRSTKAYKGGPIVRAALRLAPLLLLRPGELRAAEWPEFDLDAALWTVPAKRMKRRKEGKEHGPPHYVPLPTQAVEILRDLHLHTGHGRLVFPGGRSDDRPMSDNSVRSALIAMGYTSEIHTWHGFRATARTMLAEKLEFDPLVIEAQLAHAVKDANGRAYNRTTYLNQRRAMMQAWADYLEQLAAGAKVIPFRAA